MKETNNIIAIETARLRLRDLEPTDDNDNFKALIASLPIMNYSAWKSIYPEREYWQRLYNICLDFKKEQPRLHYVLNVELKDSKEIIGTASIFCSQLLEYMLAPQAEGTIRFAVYNAYQGLSYSLEILKALVILGFDKLNLHRICCLADQNNLGLQKILERFGFRKEGLFKEYMFRDNQWHDHYTYAMLDHEWKNKIHS